MNPVARDFRCTLATGLAVGFVLGLVVSLPAVLDNHYFRFALYRLAADTVQDGLRFWIGVGLGVAAALTLIYHAILPVARRLTARRSPKRPGTRVRVAVGLSVTIFFFSTAWLANRYLLPHRLHPMSLLADAVIALLSLGLWCLLIRIDWHSQAARATARLVRRSSVVAVIAMLVIEVGVLVDHRVHVPTGPNVIVVVIDALRRDHLGLYGYGRDTSPYLDRFAAQAHVFPNAISQCSWTSPSIATLFSSVYPSVHGVVSYNARAAQHLPRKLVTIAEALRNDGYTTGAFVANHWISRDLRFDQGFDVFDSISDEFKPNATEVNRKTLRWLERIQGRPFFTYIHYMDVHGPYRPPAPFDRLFRAGETRAMMEEEAEKLRYLSVGREVDHNNLNYYLDQYDGAVRYMDSQIERLFEQLGKGGLLENTVIVVTADHGEAFFEHGFCDHGWTVYGEEIDIPLIVKLPAALRFEGDEARRVGLMDVGPTLLDFAGIVPRYATHGFNLSRPLPEGVSGARAVYSEELSARMKGPAKLALIRDNIKVIFSPALGRVVELYDLANDSDELTNLLQAEVDVAASLEQEVRAWLQRALRRRSELGLEATSSSHDEDVLRRLKSLGYL